MKALAYTPFFIGIAGGSASGKSWLASHLARTLGRRRCTVIAHDRYYHDHPDLSLAARRRLDYDHPDAIENSLLLNHLRILQRGQRVDLPHYNYSLHRRDSRTTPLAPKPIIIIEGLFVLANPHLRRALDLKIFVHAPSDIRLIRRIRRDTTQRKQALNEVLARYETHVRPGYERHVEPSRRFCDLLWDQPTDPTFPDRLIASLQHRL